MSEVKAPSEAKAFRALAKWWALSTGVAFLGYWLGNIVVAVIQSPHDALALIVVGLAVGWLYALGTVLAVALVHAAALFWWPYLAAIAPSVDRPPGLYVSCAFLAAPFAVFVHDQTRDDVGRQWLAPFVYALIVVAMIAPRLMLRSIRPGTFGRMPNATA
jgi:hypothetical protein